MFLSGDGVVHVMLFCFRFFVFGILFNSGRQTMKFIFLNIT